MDMAKLVVGLAVAIVNAIPTLARDDGLACRQRRLGEPLEVISGFGPVFNMAGLFSSS